MEPVRNDTTTDRRTAVELAKRLLVDLIWRTAKIEVDGVTFPDTQEIFDGRAPEGMSVDDIVTVNNIKRAWGFLLGNIDHPVDWQYIREYNRIIGEGRVRDAGRLREYGVRIGGTGWVPEIPTVESPQERVRGILEESEGEDTAMLLFGAVTRGQWFSDGNKRTALMVANHQLIHDGIGVFSIPPEDKAQFVSMLLRYYETGDYSRLSDWLSQNAVGHVPGGLTLAQATMTHRRSPTSKPHGTTRGATTRTAAPNGVSTTRTASQSAWPAPARPHVLRYAQGQSPADHHRTA